MQIKNFPVNSKNSYVVFENNDKIEELEPFMKENKLSRVIFSGFLGYNKSVLPFNNDIDVIEEITIQCSNITDVTPLYHLSNIKKISIEENTALAHPFDIRKIVNLTDFFTDKKIDNLIATLAQKNNLEKLTLWNQGNLDSIIPLSKLEHLTTLNIWEQTKIIDGKISFLNQMQNLKKIDIRKYIHYH